MTKPSTIKDGKSNRKVKSGTNTGETKSRKKQKYEKHNTASNNRKRPGAISCRK